jgi:hypothetical protein
MTEAAEISFRRVIRESEKRAGTVKAFTMYGKRLAFKTNSPAVEREISEDLKNFVDRSTKERDVAVYGFLETRKRLNALASPPPGAILVWKSLDHSQFHYQLDDAVIMYHTKDEKIVAVTLSFNSHDSTVCFSIEKDVLYELCLFELEKRAAKLLEKEGKRLLHASSVEVDGRGLLFPATSGFGKTFLTLVLLNNGHRLLADDKTFVDPTSMTIFPYSRRLRVDRRSAVLFPALRPFLRSSERRFLNYKAKYFIDAQKAWPGSRGSECPLDCIIFPTVWVSAESKLVPCRTELALSRLLTSMKLFHQELTRPETQAALELATRVPSYNLLMGTDISAIEKAIRPGIKARVSSSWEAS